jgi:predicted esterase
MSESFPKCSRTRRGEIARLLTAGLPLALLSLGALAQSTSSLISVGDHRLEVIAKGGSLAESCSGARYRIGSPNEPARLLTSEPGSVESETGPEPRTAKQIAIELRELLERERISGPIVLVGHSAGGMYARVFAHEYPKQIAALVLVDPATEGDYERLRNETPDEWQNAPARMSVGPRQ